MNGFQLFFSRLCVCWQEFIITAVEESPQLFDETVHAVYSVCIPWFGLLYRAEEHFVHTQRIGAIFFYNHIGIHNVVHRFTHLLYSPSANVFAILEEELGLIVLRTPVFKGFYIQYII